MKILVAEDDALSRKMLAALLARFPATILLTEDGISAWNMILSERPTMIVLDWTMPGLSGIEICRRLREHPAIDRPYVVMVTSKGATDDVVSAFAAGADDYVTKPYEPTQLRARISAGLRLAARDQHLVRERAFLRSALTRLHDLPQLVPICSCCKRVRDERDGSWQAVEQFVSKHSGIHFSHSLCPACLPAMMADIEPALAEPGGGGDPDATR